MIYDDPLTEKKPEGEAKLVKMTMDGVALEQWLVKFVEDGDRAYSYPRWIKKETTS